MSWYLGIDIGSASSKAVLMDENKQIRKTAVLPFGIGSSGPERVIDTVLQDKNLTVENVKYIVGTGYGRKSLSFIHKEITEISCHAKGVHHIFPNVRTILDIGGQDVKTISIDETGRIIEFYMNDKCAAGTGRFLEVMARILECPINQLGELDALSKKPVTVSSTCTVFAESEVISLLSQNLKKEDIARGIHLSIISRAMGLLYRTRMEDDFSMTGGVAQNKGVVTSLESAINKKIYVSEYAQLMGAVGAALFAVEMEMER